MPYDVCTRHSNRVLAHEKKAAWRSARVGRRFGKVTGFTCLLLSVLCLFVDAARATQSDVTLNWDASPSGNVSGYRVYFGAESGNYTNMTDVGNATTDTISGLEDGVTYYFVVSAYDATGIESDFSNEATYTPSISVAPPPIPSLQLGADATGQMILTLAGPAGQTFDLLASTDLQNWILIRRLTVGSGGLFGFMDPDVAKYPARFYRTQVTQPAVQLRVDLGGNAVLTVVGQNNHDYEIDASSDLVTWTAIGDVTLGAEGLVEFTDTNAANYPVRYYRTLDVTP